MGNHIESQDTSVSERSDVMVETGPVEITRRQLREAEAALRQSEMTTVDLDPVSVSKLVAEVVSVADAAIADRVERQLQQLRDSGAPVSVAVAVPVAAAAELPLPLPLRRERIRNVVETPLTSSVDAPLSDFAAAPAEHVAPTSRKSSRQSQKTVRSAQQGPTPPRSAPPRGMSASTKKPHWRRRATARFLTVTAMVFVAAMAVATSVPANALLSAQDVENLKVAQGKDVVTQAQDGQSIEASGSSVAAGRDGVSVSGAEPVKAFTDSSSSRISPIVPSSSGPILWPFPSAVPLTDGFGARANMWTWGGWTGNFHSGQDFDPGYGTPIQAVADGIVVEVSSNLCGQAVVISHNVKGEKFDSEYCHMIYGSPNVTVGESITAGTIVGNVGQTGMATGPHLHLEIHVGGNAIDPLGFLRARSTEW